MMLKICALVVTLASLANAAAPQKTTQHTSTTTPATTTTYSSVLSRPTWFNVIARNSGIKYDGKMLMGTDQSFSNMTFGGLPSDVYPSSKIYLSGTNKSPRLKGTTGEQMWGGYHGSDSNPGPDDSSQAWLFFGGSEFSLYGYSLVLCSAVQKTDGNFHLACSVKAADGKVDYRKAMINEYGELSLLPLNSVLPKGFNFVEMEIKPLSGSAPTSIPPCCP